MSYLVLARKWRPQGFDDLTGQQTIVKILQNAIKQGRIAHAYLFSGPRGVGKTTTARILAKALNCQNGPTHEPCNHCDACNAITEGRSMDVIEIDGASTNSVEHIRQIREQVRYAPSSSRYKVYIIDEVHMLSQSAFNALLKTLEEPPEHVIFILATTEPHKVPVTVQSRCQHLPFRRIATEEIRKRLERIAQEEGLRLTDGALEMISRVSEGSLRDALTLLDQVSAFTDEVTEETVQALIGVTDTTKVLNLVRAVLGGQREEILKLVEEVYETGADFKAILSDMVSVLRTMLVAKITRTIELPELTETQKLFLKDTIPVYTEEEIFLVLNELLKLEGPLKNATFPRIAFEMGLLRASMATEMKTVSKVLERLEEFLLESPQKEPEERATPVTAPSAEEMKKTEEPVPDEAPEAAAFEWDAVIATVEEDDHVLASRLIHAQPKVEGSTLKLIFNGGHSIHADSVKKDIGLLRDVVSRLTKGRIKQVLVETTSQSFNKPINNNGLSEAEKLILNNLGGRIVERRKRDV
ncbi:MAG: DNA polymerase III subunit gamma/tau [Nitrospirae bacterium]|nr:MAG: DNA polymerase III subunit gamma/tau [Nitrospirota bacterium]